MNLNLVQCLERLGIVSNSSLAMMNFLQQVPHLYAIGDALVSFTLGQQGTCGVPAGRISIDWSEHEFRRDVFDRHIWQKADRKLKPPNGKKVYFTGLHAPICDQGPPRFHAGPSDWRTALAF